MSRNLIEFKSRLKSQIQDAISTAIFEKKPPSIQNTLSMQGKTILPWGTEDAVGYEEAPEP